MKIISLNCWGGHEFESLMDFIREHKDTTDIFCLQEVFSTRSENTTHDGYRLNLVEEFASLLKDFAYSLAVNLENIFPNQGPVDYPLEFGNAVFYRKSLESVSVENKKILEWKDEGKGYSYMFGTTMQIVDLEVDEKKLRVVNVHGMPFPGSKLDTAERLLQSRTILESFPESGEFLVMGDFNLLSETKSISMFEEAGMRNLISEYEIETTRSVLNSWRGKPGEQKHADCTFVTKGIEVKRFEVPDIAISDHLPMIMEFEV